MNNMEFDFFNEWEQVGTVKVGSQLTKKLVKLESLDNLDMVESQFPSEHPDAGCEIERYVLGKGKYLFAKEISNILSDECYKLASSESDSQIESVCEINNPQVLVKLLSLLIDSNTTHFTLG